MTGIFKSERTWLIIAGALVLISTGCFIGAAIVRDMALDTSATTAATEPLELHPTPTDAPVGNDPSAQPIPVPSTDAIDELAGEDASETYESAELVPGAFTSAGYWWVPCSSPYAVTPQQFATGCWITGFEPSTGSLIPTQSAAPTADPVAIELAATFLDAWVTYDSTDEASRTAALAALVSSDADLPAEPELAWPQRASEYADAGFTASVELAGEPTYVTSSVVDGSTTVSMSVEIDASYTIDQSCLPDQLGPAETCELSHLEQRGIWTVHLAGGQIVGLEEPGILG